MWTKRWKKRLVTCPSPAVTFGSVSHRSALTSCRPFQTWDDIDLSVSDSLYVWGDVVPRGRSQYNQAEIENLLWLPVSECVCVYHLSSLISHLSFLPSPHFHSFLLNIVRLPSCFPSSSLSRVFFVSLSLPFLFLFLLPCSLYDPFLRPWPH